MTQEQKELLLADLCERLPHGVICKDTNINITGTLSQIGLHYDMCVLDKDNGDSESCYILNCKPYLFPLSSMTEEQKQYLKNRFCYDWNGEPYDIWKCQIEIGDADELIDFFHKNHLDYHNLIPKGLAINATGLNIYIDY
jgi:hypothetical protein